MTRADRLAQLRLMRATVEANRHLPARRATKRAHNDQGLRAARNEYGLIRFRLFPFFRRGGMYRGLRGEAILLTVSEVVDYWALWGDLRRFLVAWRPRRLRSEAGQQATDRLLAEWERLGRDG